MDHLVVWLDDEIEYELALLLRISSLDCERVRSTFIVWSLAGEAERSIFSVCQRRFVPPRGWLTLTHYGAVEAFSSAFFTRLLRYQHDIRFADVASRRLIIGARKIRFISKSLLIGLDWGEFIIARLERAWKICFLISVLGFFPVCTVQ
jgi:hypothetical protein